MSPVSYQFFDSFVVRRPQLSLINLKKTLKDSEDFVYEIMSSSLCREALYLASPELYAELQKYRPAEIQDSTQAQALPKSIKNTLLKYFIRMSTRCTPFGLFSGVGIGKFCDHHLVPYDGASIPEQMRRNDKSRDTKVDMHFLVNLTEYLGELPHIQEKILFYPNNSIYTVGDHIRYIEYEYVQGKREYLISSAPLSDELVNILKYAQQGRTISDLSKLLVDDEISLEEAKGFVDELIENQVPIF